MNYAIINHADTVVNIVRWDGVTPWSPLPGYSAIWLQPGEACAKGWWYVGTSDPRFIEPQE